MRVWKKLAAAKWEDAWVERLRFLGEERLVITAFPGRKTVCVEVYGVSAKEARVLVGEFGGQVRVIRDRALAQPPPRVPIRVRRKLLVVASGRERVECARKFSGRKIALLPAGMAFGTGEHATTSSCLRFLADCSDAFAAQPWDMLDLGTGSGLLAIAAKMLGASRVDAFDFDKNCIRIAKENARANAVRIAVKHADVLRWRPPRAWHVVTANLYSEILMGAAKTIAHATAPGGVLIFSGVLRAQEKDCVCAFAACGFRLDRIVRKGKWVTVKMTKCG